jgi:hypothetical protein
MCTTVQFIKHYTRSICFISLMSSVMMLTGCARLIHHLGYEQIKQPIQHSCLGSKVLITNLNVQPSQQYYQLPDGTACKEVNHVSS